MSRLATSVTAALAVAAVTSATTVVGDARADTPGTQFCTRYTAILAPGTWETHPDADPRTPVGMLRPLGDGLQAQFGSDITVLYTPYAASAFDQGLTYAESLSTLDSSLRRMVANLCDSTRLMLAGYSQGADGIGDLATEIGNGSGPIDAERVVGVGLLADPHRDPSTTLELGTPQPGNGIAGSRSQDFGALTDRVRTLCAEGDLYCSVNAATSPFVSALGKVLSGDPAMIAYLVPAYTEPGTLVEQAVTVGAGWAAIAANLPAILDSLHALPDLITAGDIAAAHQLASGLNAALSPMVEAAAGVDLPLIASVIRAAATIDPSGWTAAASVIADALVYVDIPRIAALVGHMQETLWRAVESLTRNDPLAVAAELTTLTPTIVDLVGATAGPLLTAVSGNLAFAVQTLLSIGGPESIDELVQLASQGTALASFYASKAHVDYGEDVQTLLGFLRSQVDS